MSKIMKITADKFFSIKNSHGIRRRHRCNCSVKKEATVFSVVLARIGTHKGSFKILNRAQKPDPPRPEPGPQTPSSPLPPLVSPEKRTVFLDLDETLVHSVAAPCPKRFDFVVHPNIHGNEMTFYVVKRPGVDQFLQKLAEKYELVVFTAGMREYATLVLDRLDIKRVISHRLYRDSCKEVNGRYVKDLSGLGRDLRRVVIVDDNPNSYVLQPENGVPVRPFIDDVEDRELGRLLEFFEREEPRCEDIRDAVKQFVGSISDDDDDDDDGDDNGGGIGEDDELEMRDGKSTNVPVLTTINSPRPCFISLHDYFASRKPVVLECWIKMIILGSLVLIIINAILCFRTGMLTLL